MALPNKLGITDALELAHEGERLSKLAAISLYWDGALESMEPGTFDTLARIHAHLFGDVYEFAGRVRTVNIAKGSFRFASVLYLEDAIRKIEAMPQNTFGQVVEKYMEMNVAHPFREGNGRAGRIWLDHMMRAQLGRTVDWSVVEREDYLLAMERSVGRDTELKALLAGALSEDLDDASLLARGIDASYAYEGYAAYRAEEL